MKNQNEDNADFTIPQHFFKYFKTILLCCEKIIRV